MNKYKGFYKKSVDERIKVLIDDNKYETSIPTRLDTLDASHMIENAIGVFEVPLGVAPGFLINNRTYNVVMATEESSVIAAASNAAKISSMSGGFSTTINERLMRGEIVFANPKDSNALKNTLKASFETLKNIADEAYPSIIKRGGGVSKFEIRHLNNESYTFVILDVFMDTQEAMGANMMNTVLESISAYLESVTQETALISILSNLVTEALVSATCIIDPKYLKDGIKTAQNIELASELAKQDIYRCATHNKGIMNGVDAVVLASGNDTRAVNAAIYTFSALTGSPQPLATWKLIDKMLHGTITLPLPIGSVGGAISIHPKAKLFKSILEYKTVKELMEIIASVGLAQNFAALNALTTVGIQKGHMALHAKNIAISAGAPAEYLEEVTERLKEESIINIDVAKKIIKELTDYNN